MLRPMENASDDFLTVLRKALAARAVRLEESAVPALEDGLRTFKSLIGNTVDTLVRKPRNCSWPEWVKDNVVDQLAVPTGRS